MEGLDYIIPDSIVAPKRSKVNRNRSICPICLLSHSLRKCKKFLNYSPTQRYIIIAGKQHCQNCISPFHTHESCNSGRKCQFCQENHNTLLHGALQMENGADSSAWQWGVLEHTHGLDDSECNEVFLPTATVKVKINESAKPITARALINPSLTKSRISRGFVMKHKMDVVQINEYDFTAFEIQSKHSEKSHKILALITNQLPMAPYSKTPEMDPCFYFPTADENLMGNGLVEIEIGSDVYPYMSALQKSDTYNGQIFAARSDLGHLYYGPVQTELFHAALDCCPDCF